MPGKQNPLVELEAIKAELVTMFGQDPMIGAIIVTPLVLGVLKIMCATCYSNSRNNAIAAHPGRCYVSSKVFSQQLYLCFERWAAKLSAS